MSARIHSLQFKIQNSFSHNFYSLILLFTPRNNYPHTHTKNRIFNFIFFLSNFSVWFCWRDKFRIAIACKWNWNVHTHFALNLNKGNGLRFCFFLLLCCFFFHSLSLCSLIPFIQPIWEMKESTLAFSISKNE